MVKYRIKHVTAERLERERVEDIYRGADAFYICCKCYKPASYDRATIEKWLSEIKALCPDSVVYLSEGASSSYEFNPSNTPLFPQEEARELAKSLGIEYVTNTQDALVDETTQYGMPLLPRTVRAVFERKKARGESIGGGCSIC